MRPEITLGESVGIRYVIIGTPYTYAAVDSPNRKVKLTHVTDEETLRGMLKEVEERRREEVVNQCMPLLEIIQRPRVQLGQWMTSMETCQRKWRGLGHR